LTRHERLSDDEGRAATSAGREHYFEVGYVTIAGVMLVQVLIVAFSGSISGRAR
jgi:hypothetical protein